MFDASARRMRTQCEMLWSCRCRKCVMHSHSAAAACQTRLLTLLCADLYTVAPSGSLSEVTHGQRLINSLLKAIACVLCRRMCEQVTRDKLHAVHDALCFTGKHGHSKQLATLYSRGSQRSCCLMLRPAALCDVTERAGMHTPHAPT
jgi:hypothetical protein